MCTKVESLTWTPSKERGLWEHFLTACSLERSNRMILKGSRLSTGEGLSWMMSCTLRTMSTVKKHSKPLASLSSKMATCPLPFHQNREQKERLRSRERCRCIALWGQRSDGAPTRLKRSDKSSTINSLRRMEATSRTLMSLLRRARAPSEPHSPWQQRLPASWLTQPQESTKMLVTTNWSEIAQDGTINAINNFLSMIPRSRTWVRKMMSDSSLITRRIITLWNHCDRKMKAQQARVNKLIMMQRIKILSINPIKILMQSMA